MNWIIPGTAVEGLTSDADRIREQFDALFLAGDIVLGQVSHFSGLPDYMIQNWVKRGFLAPPKSKRYSKNQLCRILNINMLKGALSMDSIVGLLSYINGRLDDESDDLIDDAELYFLFVRLAAGIAATMDKQVHEEAITAVLESLPEKYPGSNARIGQVLAVMLSAWIATNFKNDAEARIAAMKATSAKEEPL